MSILCSAEYTQLIISSHKSRQQVHCSCTDTSHPDDLSHTRQKHACSIDLCLHILTAENASAGADMVIAQGYLDTTICVLEHFNLLVPDQVASVSSTEAHTMHLFACLALRPVLPDLSSVRLLLHSRRRLLHTALQFSRSSCFACTSQQLLH